MGSWGYFNRMSCLPHLSILVNIVELNAPQTPSNWLQEGRPKNVVLDPKNVITLIFQSDLCRGLLWFSVRFCEVGVWLVWDLEWSCIDIRESDRDQFQTTNAREKKVWMNAFVQELRVWLWDSRVVGCHTISIDLTCLVSGSQWTRHTQKIPQQLLKADWHWIKNHRWVSFVVCVVFVCVCEIAVFSLFWGRIFCPFVPPKCRGMSLWSRFSSTTFVYLRWWINGEHTSKQDALLGEVMATNMSAKRSLLSIRRADFCWHVEARVETLTLHQYMSREPLLPVDMLNTQFGSKLSGLADMVNTLNVKGASKDLSHTLFPPKLQHT